MTSYLAFYVHHRHEPDIGDLWVGSTPSYPQWTCASFSPSEALDRIKHAVALLEREMDA